MSPTDSPKTDEAHLSPTFQFAPPDNRVITWEQLQSLINFGVKTKMQAILEQRKQSAPPSNHQNFEHKRFGQWMPRCDIWDDPTSTTVIASFELPGVRREDLSVHVQDHRYLVISGTRHCRLGDVWPSISALPSQPIFAADQLAAGETNVDSSEQSAQPIGRFDRAELRYGKFSRKLDLGYELKNDLLTADLKEGMLIVTWPRIPPGSEGTNNNSRMIAPIATPQSSHIENRVSDTSMSAQ